MANVIILASGLNFAQTAIAQTEIVQQATAAYQNKQFDHAGLLFSQAKDWVALQNRT